jgi:hypothetical protein
MNFKFDPTKVEYDGKSIKRKIDDMHEFMSWLYAMRDQIAEELGFEPTEEVKLMQSIKEGKGQVFMRIDTGDLFIFWPESVNSYYDGSSITNYVDYRAENLAFSAIRGSPFVHNFEYIGEFGDVNE